MQVQSKNKILVELLEHSRSSYPKVPKTNLGQSKQDTRGLMIHNYHESNGTHCTANPTKAGVMFVL